MDHDVLGFGGDLMMRFQTKASKRTFVADGREKEGAMGRTGDGVRGAVLFAVMFTTAYAIGLALGALITTVAMRALS